MKVVFATEYYPPFAPGGSPWSIRLLAEALAARGHGVTVVTPDWGAAAPTESRDGVTIERFPAGFRLRDGVTLAPTRRLVSPGFHVRLARAVVRAVRRSGADVVHAQDKHALVGSYLAARRLGRPVFVTLRDTGLLCPIATCLLEHARVPGDCGQAKLQRECAPFFLDHYIRGGALRRVRVRAVLAVLYADARLKGAALRRVDGVVSVSQGLLDIYLAAGRGRRERATVVYTLPPAPRRIDGQEAAGLRARHGLEGRTVVLYLGKLSIGKGGPVFLRAAAQVARVRPSTVFVVVGPDAPSPAPGGADLRWIGILPHDAVLALYAAADIVVVPSVGPEALSRVPLEAAAAGRPTIGARAGGIPEEIADGETGLLVERGDAGALAGAILRLVDDEPLRRRLGARARSWVAERFDADRIVGTLVDLYATAIRAT